MSHGWRRNIVEAEQSRRFFDEVLFDREIEAKGWRGNDEVGAVTDRLEAETRKDVRERGVGNFDPENARHPLRAHADRVASWHRSEHIDQRPRFTAAKLEDELGRAIDGAIRIGEIDATLETEPGIGGKPRRRAFPWITAGLQNAPSRKMLVVVPLMPLCSPPMMPAKPSGFFSSATRRRSGSSASFWPFNSVSDSPAFAK